MKDGSALFEVITKDSKLGEFEFEVVKRSRTRGQYKATLASDGEGRHGTVVIEWSASSRIMSFQISTKDGWNPHLITGDVVDYLVARHSNGIDIINVIP